AWRGIDFDAYQPHEREEAILRTMTIGIAIVVGAVAALLAWCERSSRPALRGLAHASPSRMRLTPAPVLPCDSPRRLRGTLTDPEGDTLGRVVHGTMLR